MNIRTKSLNVSESKLMIKGHEISILTKHTNSSGMSAVHIFLVFV